MKIECTVNRSLLYRGFTHYCKYTPTTVNTLLQIHYTIVFFNNNQILVKTKLTEASEI